MAETPDWPDLAGRLDQRGHLLPVRVYYEDTDFSGVVYHAAYLKFMERGRSDFLRLAGVHHSRLIDRPEGGQVAFAVRHMEIQFLRPARIDDVLEVRTATERVGGARIILDQSVRLQGETLVSARVTVALIGNDGRPRRIPADISKALRRR